MQKKIISRGIGHNLVFWGPETGPKRVRFYTFFSVLRCKMTIWVLREGGGVHENFFRANYAQISCFCRKKIKSAPSEQVSN